MKARFQTLAVLTLIGGGFLAGAVPGAAQATKPTAAGLTGNNVWLDLSVEACMERAGRALRAAGMDLHGSRYQPLDRGGAWGGNNDHLFAIITCASSDGRRSFVNISVAGPPTHRGQAYEMAQTLRRHMEGKAPRARDFTGTWNTSAGSVVTKMMLTQIGDRVTGTYDFAGGTISGTAKGNVLRYRWTQTDGRKGAGYFELVDGGNGLRGHWSHTDDPDNKSGGSWTGTRLE